MRAKRAMVLRILCIVVLVALGLYQVEQGTREVQGAPAGPSELLWVRPAEDGRWEYVVLGREGTLDLSGVLRAMKR